MKKTEWYPPYIKPARIGWYEVKTRYPDSFVGKYRYFNGRGWRWDGDMGNIGSTRYEAAFGDEHDRWRGLANNPKKGKK